MFNFSRKGRKPNPNGGILLQHSLNEMYQRLVTVLETVPEGADLDVDKESDYKIFNCIAIEEEWIIDPILRDQMSLIDVQDK